MKKRLLFFVFCSIALLGLVFFSSLTVAESKNSELQQSVYAYVVKHFNALDSLLVLAQSEKTQKAALIERFHQMRIHYKKTEMFVEFFFPADARYFINGPPVPKAEREYNYKTFEPHGFQVIEQEIFVPGELTDSARGQMNEEFALLREEFRLLTKRIGDKSFSKENLLLLIKFELIRTMSLYLQGYDGTVNRENIREIQFILNGMNDVLFMLKQADDETNTDTLTKAIAEAQNYLDKNRDFDTFDRLTFITEHLQKVYMAISEVLNETGFNSQERNFAVNMNLSRYSAKSFNRKFFTRGKYGPALLEKQSELGRILFFDPVLSGNNKRACASCHKPGLGFTDGKKASESFFRSGTLNRNTPTLLNVMYQNVFFHDGKVLQLEEQAATVLLSNEEMHGNADTMVRRLRKSEEYRLLFKKAFNGSADSSISFYGIVKSLSEYERTLLSYDSRFDKYIEGDKRQLSQEEINGFNLFAGKALCGSCHFYPLFNGTVPPYFSENEFEIIGTPEKKEGTFIDKDEGRYAVTKNKNHLHAFKTPSVRNTATSAPYMHNGSFRTLDEVIDFYNNGGGAHFESPPENQTLPFDSLKLSSSEKKSIKAFLNSLNTPLNKFTAPAKLPAFKDPAMNKRKIGGEY